MGIIFNIGDEVKILNENAEGTVTKVFGNTIFVEIDGMEFEYQRKELIQSAPRKEDEEIRAVYENIDKEIIITNPKKEKYFITKHLRQEELKGRKKGGLYAEIDLHFEEIADKMPDSSYMKKKDLQFYYFRECFEEAKELRIGRLVIIHGNGEGILRQEIRDFAKGQVNVKIQDASFRKYGRGATEIIIKGLYAT